MTTTRPDDNFSVTAPTEPGVATDAAHAPDWKPDWTPGRVTRRVIDAARADDLPDDGLTDDDVLDDDPDTPEGAKRGRGRPRTRSVDQERSMILAAARASFGELGFTGASIDDIAKRSGIQRRSVYRQFADKEDLFQAAMASAVDHVVRQLSRAFERNEKLEPSEALFHNYRRALEMVISDPSWGLVFLSSMSSTSDLSTTVVLEARRRLEAGIAASVRYRWELLGIERPERAEQIATMMVGLVMTMGTRMSLEPDLDLDEVARLMTSFTIGGVIAIEAGN